MMPPDAQEVSDAVDTDDDYNNPARNHLKMIEILLKEVQKRQQAAPDCIIRIKLKPWIREIAEDVCSIINNEHLLYEAHIEDRRNNMHIRVCECIYTWARIFLPWLTNRYIVLCVKKRNISPPTPSVI